MSRPLESLTVRGLDPETKRKLRLLAARHGRSMEEEVRSLIRHAVENPDLEAGQRPSEAEADLGTAIHRRFAKYGGIDLPILPRGPDREPPDFAE